LRPRPLAAAAAVVQSGGVDSSFGSGASASTVGERGLEGAVLTQEVGRLLRADAGRPGDLVRRVAAQRDEVGHLRRLDSVPLAHLGGPDARQLGDALHGLEDRHTVRDELERVAVGGGDDDLPRPRVRRRGEEVVGLVAGALRDEEAPRRDHLGQEAQLLEDRRLELAARLVDGQRLVPVRRYLERVPRHQHRVRLLRLPQPEQEVREADDRVQTDRLRQRVVGPVRQRVAVDR